MSLVLLLLGLLAWSAAMLFMAWQIWIAPYGYENAEGFHLVHVTDARWHHVRFHHRRRDHREFRHEFREAA